MRRDGLVGCTDTVRIHPEPGPRVLVRSPREAQTLLALVMLILVDATC